jgi:hypothetical protein
MAPRPNTLPSLTWPRGQLLAPAVQSLRPPFGEGRERFGRELGAQLVQRLGQHAAGGAISHDDIGLQRPGLPQRHQRADFREVLEAALATFGQGRECRHLAQRRGNRDCLQVHRIAHRRQRHDARPFARAFQRHAQPPGRVVGLAESLAPAIRIIGDCGSEPQAAGRSATAELS